MNKGTPRKSFHRELSRFLCFFSPPRFSPCYESREIAEPTILIPSINYPFLPRKRPWYRTILYPLRNIWNENNIMDETDSIVENFEFLFPRVYNSYSLTRFLERFHPFVSKSLKFARRSLNFMKSSWKLMISCPTTRYIAAIYKKYPSIFPFLFFSP